MFASICSLDCPIFNEILTNDRCSDIQYLFIYLLGRSFLKNGTSVVTRLDLHTIGAYDRVIEIDPDDAKAWYNKGGALGELGNHEEAIGAFDRAIEIDPADAQAWYRKGISLLISGKEDNAKECFYKASKLDSSLEMP